MTMNRIPVFRVMKILQNVLILPVTAICALPRITWLIAMWVLLYGLILDNDTTHKLYQQVRVQATHLNETYSQIDYAAMNALVHSAKGPCNNETYTWDWLKCLAHTRQYTLLKPNTPSKRSWLIWKAIQAYACDIPEYKAMGILRHNEYLHKLEVIARSSPWCSYFIGDIPARVNTHYTWQALVIRLSSVLFYTGYMPMECTGYMYNVTINYVEDFRKGLRDVLDSKKKDETYLMRNILDIKLLLDKRLEDTPMQIATRVDELAYTTIVLVCVLLVMCSIARWTDSNLVYIYDTAESKKMRRLSNALHALIVTLEIFIAATWYFHFNMTQTIGEMMYTLWWTMGFIAVYASFKPTQFSIWHIVGLLSLIGLFQTRDYHYLALVVILAAKTLASFRYWCKNHIVVEGKAEGVCEKFMIYETERAGNENKAEVFRGLKPSKPPRHVAVITNARVTTGTIEARGLVSAVIHNGVKYLLTAAHVYDDFMAGGSFYLINHDRNGKRRVTRWDTDAFEVAASSPVRYSDYVLLRPIKGSFWCQSAMSPMKMARKIGSNSCVRLYTPLANGVIYYSLGKQSVGALPRQHFHTASTVRGSSGSPVVVNDKIVGVHSAATNMGSDVNVFNDITYLAALLPDKPTFENLVYETRPQDPDEDIVWEEQLTKRERREARDIHRDPRRLDEYDEYGETLSRRQLRMQFRVGEMYCDIREDNGRTYFRRHADKMERYIDMRDNDTPAYWGDYEEFELVKSSKRSTQDRVTTIRKMNAVRLETCIDDRNVDFATARADYRKTHMLKCHYVEPAQNPPEDNKYDLEYNIWEEKYNLASYKFESRGHDGPATKENISEVKKVGSSSVRYPDNTKVKRVQDTPAYQHLQRGYSDLMTEVSKLEYPPTDAGAQLDSLQAHAAKRVYIPRPPNKALAKLKRRMMKAYEAIKGVRPRIIQNGDVDLLAVEDLVKEIYSSGNTKAGVGVPLSVRRPSLKQSELMSKISMTELNDIVVKRMRAILDSDIDESTTAVELVEQKLADPVRLFIKNEPMPPRKINNKRYRLIQSFSFIDGLIQKLLFRDQMKAEIRSWQKIPSKPGADFYTDAGKEELRANILELKKIADKSGNKLYEVDLTSFDWQMPEWLLWNGIDLRLDFMGLKQNEAPRYRKLVLWCKLALTRKVFLLNNGDLYTIPPGVQGSGHGLTSSGNSANSVSIAILNGAERAYANGDDALVVMSDSAVKKCKNSSFNYKFIGESLSRQSDKATIPKPDKSVEYCSQYIGLYSKEFRSANADKILFKFIKRGNEVSVEDAYIAKSMIGTGLKRYKAAIDDVLKFHGKNQAVEVIHM